MGNRYEQGSVSAGHLKDSSDGGTMNRAFYIILIPALLVAVGYLVVFRFIGVSPAYWRLMLPIIFFAGLMAWLRWYRTTRKTGSGPQ
jgi:Flp pilus assembly protein TadB